MTTISLLKKPQHNLVVKACHAQLVINTQIFVYFSKKTTPGEVNNNLKEDVMGKEDQGQTFEPKRFYYIKISLH